MPQENKEKFNGNILGKKFKKEIIHSPIHYEFIGLLIFHGFLITSYIALAQDNGNIGRTAWVGWLTFRLYG